MPGEIDPNSDPPTDALTAGIGHGAPMIALHEEAAARRDAAMRARGTPKTPPTAEARWVVPRAGSTILDIDGVPYPAGGVAVLSTDAYAHRRVRDGSLLIVGDIPVAAGTLAVEESGEDVLDALLERAKPGGGPATNREE